jgi:hypothetical protein
MTRLLYLGRRRDVQALMALQEVGALIRHIQRGVEPMNRTTNLHRLMESLGGTYGVQRVIESS